MIILDTNVISEPLRAGCSPKVIEWLDGQSAETLYLASTSLAELYLGIELMPKGKRRDVLRNALGEFLPALFGKRILPFDQEAAKIYGVLVGKARSTGKTVSIADGQIAAIASVHGFAVATRDVVPFAALGIPVINPWR